MKMVLAATGASGSIYMLRLLHHIDCHEHTVHIVFSDYARQVARHELGAEFELPDGVLQHTNNTMDVPFVSGSSDFDAMIIAPCSMSTIAKIAHGISDNTICRAADVFIKEHKNLILVPRETPINIIHAKNILGLLEAGVRVLPASPSFYSQPKSITELVDTVVFRVLRQIGMCPKNTYSWQGKK